MPLTLLFDLDGTLVDTDPLHFQAYLTLLAGAGKPTIDFDFYRTRIMGFGHSDIFSMLFPESGGARHRELAERKEELFRQQLREHSRQRSLEPRPGLLALLDWAQARRVRCGVVTNAPRDNATLMLDGLGLSGRFDTIVFGEELPQPKPHPMPYLTGLERLGGRAEEALAFEDSLSGVRSASGAGLYTCGVAATLPAAALRAAGAVHTVEDFRDAVLWAELRSRAAPATATSA